MSRRISRRAMLKHATVAGASVTVPVRVLAQVSADEPYVNLNSRAAGTLEAIVARLIPSDENGPGAAEAGAARYIDRGLGDALAASRDAYIAGLEAVDAFARDAAGSRFAELDADAQDAVLARMEANTATGFSPDSVTFFELLRAHTIEGTFSDPAYGGNRDFVGWELIAYPGVRLAVTAADQAMDAALPPTRVSAYDLPMFATDDFSANAASGGNATGDGSAGDRSTGSDSEGEGTP